MQTKLVRHASAKASMPQRVVVRDRRRHVPAMSRFQPRTLLTIALFALSSEDLEETDSARSSKSSP